jgi:hypothetical protein
LSACNIEIGIEVERDGGQVVHTQQRRGPVRPFYKAAESRIGQRSRAELLLGTGRIQRTRVISDATGEQDRHYSSDEASHD